MLSLTSCRLAFKAFCKFLELFVCVQDGCIWDSVQHGCLLIIRCRNFFYNHEDRAGCQRCICAREQESRHNGLWKIGTYWMITHDRSTCVCFTICFIELDWKPFSGVRNGPLSVCVFGFWCVLFAILCVIHSKPWLSCFCLVFCVCFVLLCLIYNFRIYSFALQ